LDIARITTPLITEQF